MAKGQGRNAALWSHPHLVDWEARGAAQAVPPAAAFCTHDRVAHPQRAVITRFDPATWTEAKTPHDLLMEWANAKCCGQGRLSPPLPAPC